jgi:hypothetical protein
MVPVPCRLVSQYPWSSRTPNGPIDGVNVSRPSDNRFRSIIGLGVRLYQTGAPKWSRMIRYGPTVGSGLTKPDVVRYQPGVGFPGLRTSKRGKFAGTQRKWTSRATPWRVVDSFSNWSVLSGMLVVPVPIGVAGPPATEPSPW